MSISSIQILLRKSLTRFSYSFFGYVRSPFYPSRYSIKPGYFHRKAGSYFNDLENTDEYQKEVYQYASNIMDCHQFKKVIDLGCGSAFKLIKYLGNYETLGIDVKQTVEILRQRYPDREWIEEDKVVFKSCSTDVIICADVIEHVEDPDDLLYKVLSISDWKYLLISTPERDLRRGKFSFGPPENVYHIREWNSKELLDYLSTFFKIEKHFISNASQCTQAALCTPRSNT